MKRSLNRFIDYIGSRKFAIILLIITTSILLVTNLIPNPIFMSDGEAERFVRERPILYRISNLFQVMNITRSPYFLIIPAFIVTSITLCTYRRLRMWAAANTGERMPVVSELRFSGSGILNVPDVMELLESKGWRVREEGAGGFFYAVRGMGGIWGSVAFHAGMIIVIVGAIVSMRTLFNGELRLTEGYEVSPPELLNKVLEPSELVKFPYTKMLLESFEARYVEGGFSPLDYKAGVQTMDREGRTEFEVIKVNQALRKGGYQFLLHKYYFAPRFVITEKASGRVISDAFINLLLITVDMTDQFEIPETDIRINASFFPDFYRDGDRPKTMSMNLDNPVFILEFFKGEDKLGDGILHLGKKMDFDKGAYTIEFRDLRKWVILGVSRDYGLPVVEWGLLLMVLGLVARLVLNEKRLWIKVNMRDGLRMVEWGGRAGYFPALFEEEMRLIGEDLRLETEDVET